MTDPVDTSDEAVQARIEALDDILDASCPWLDGDTRYAIATKLAMDGYTLIPTAQVQQPFAGDVEALTAVLDPESDDPEGYAKQFIGELREQGWLLVRNIISFENVKASANSFGHTLIPTDPASVEDMVDRVRQFIFENRRSFEVYKHQTELFKSDLARAVLTAAIPGLIPGPESASDARPSAAHR